MEDEDDPPSFSFHAFTASIMLMPADILSFRKRLYSLGLRFSFFAGFLPNWAMVLSCRFSASEMLLSSLLIDVCAFSRLPSLVFRLPMSARMAFGLSRPESRVFTDLMSARRDFGIPFFFGMPHGVCDEKKRIPEAPSYLILDAITDDNAPRDLVSGAGLQASRVSTRS